MIKRKTNSNRSPFDVHDAYTDAVFNEGSISSDKLIDDSNSLVDDPIFQSTSLGGISYPLQNSYAYADTPESCIFLTKRQFSEQEFLYTSNSQERPGKREELLARIVFGNIIQRKLDYLNNHEIVTKINPYVAALNKRETPIGSENNLPGSQLTRYYTEDFTLEEENKGFVERVVQTQDSSKLTFQDYIEIVHKIRSITTDKGKKGRLRIRTEPNYSAPILTSFNQDAEIPTSGMGVDYKKPDNLISFGVADQSPLKGVYDNQIAKWWKIDLTTISSLSNLAKFLDTGSTRATPNNPNASQHMLGENVDVVIKNLQSLKDVNGKEVNRYGYIAILETDNHVVSDPIEREKFLIDYEKESILSKEKTLKEEKVTSVYKKDFKNLFNGVIEIANVDSIRTNTTNKENQIGNASFTLQNPNNILVITEDDIEIALGEHPFLDETIDEEGKIIGEIEEVDPISGENLKYYNFRGRYYTEYVYNLVTENFIRSIYNTNKNQINSLVAMLEEDKRVLQVLLTRVNEGGDSQTIFDGIDLVALNRKFPSVGNYVVRIKTIINKGDIHLGYPLSGIAVNLISNRIEDINSVITDLSSLLNNRDINKLYSGNLSEKEERQRNFLRFFLKKHYQNKTIFEVYDKVNIWMTSPSRTLRVDENGTIFSEDPGSSKLLLKRIQDLISVIKQFDSFLYNIVTPHRHYFEEDIQKINEGLLIGSVNLIDGIMGFIDSDIKNKPLGYDLYFNTLSSKATEYESFYAELVKKGDPTVYTLKSTDLYLRGVNPFDLLTTKGNYAGAFDQQFQVFEGVIKGISRSYSDGVYTIEINCADNLDYLERSRYTTEPNLLSPSMAGAPMAFLDDPIWRAKDRNIIARTDTTKIPDPDTLVGRWKAGVLTLTANVISKKEDKDEKRRQAKDQPQIADVSNSFPVEDLNRIVGLIPYAENEPFNGADPADIISILVTGIPFNLTNYLRNTYFGGSLNVTPRSDSDSTKRHYGDIVKYGPIEATRQEIEGQKKKYGNFEPYLEVTKQSITKNDISDSSIKTSMNLLVSIVLFIKQYSRSHSLLFDKLINQIAELEKTKKDGIWFSINDLNVKDGLINIEEFPNTPSEIKLNSTFEGFIGDQLKFFIYAAIKTAESEQGTSGQQAINQINILLSKNDDPKGLESFSQGGSGAFDKENSFRYQLQNDDYNFFKEIVRTTRERLDKGNFYNKILEWTDTINEDNIEDILRYRTARVPDINEILKLKKARDFYLPNPLQATKESIILKIKPNFLVISDKYALNDDLIDYARQIKSSTGDLRPAQTQTTLERCRKSAKRIDYEFYCDSQGNIRFKPPTYNRVFLKHLYNIDDVDPLFRSKFLEILKSQDAMDQAFKAPLLQEYRNLVINLKKEYWNNLKFISQEGGNFEIETKQTIASTTHYRSSTLMNLVENKWKEIEENYFKVIDFPFEVLTIIGKKVFDIDSEIDFVINEMIKNSSYESKENYKSLNEIKNDISHRGSYGIFSINLMEYNKKLIKASIDNNGRVPDKILESANKELVDLTIDLIKDMLDIFKNICTLLLTIEDNLAKLQPKIAAYLEEMTDTKFVHNIPSSIIISERYEENPPDYTRRNCFTEYPYMNGELSGDNIEQQYMSWAGSVDYDLWRKYGYIQGDDYYCPFLQRPEQVAIYSHMLMMRQYSKIIQGSLTVRGDAKYNVGDVVFIEDMASYAYIVNVTHNFQYGGKYDTTLSLEYFRNIGAWISQPFDVIGEKAARGANLLFNDSTPISLSEVLEAYKIQEGSLK